jgi:hypothetical protein
VSTTPVISCSAVSMTPAKNLSPGCPYPKSPWPGRNILFPAGESLVSDIILLPARESLDSYIPARDVEIDSLFYSVAFYICCLGYHRLTLNKKTSYPRHRH